MKNLLGLKIRSIKHRMVIGFSVIIVLVVGLGVFNFLDSRAANKVSQEIVDKELPLAIIDQQLATNMSEKVSLSRAYVMFGGDYKTKYLEQVNITNQLYEAAEKIVITEAFSALIEETNAWDKVIVEELFPAYESGNIELANQIANETATRASDLMERFAAFANVRQNNVYEMEATVLADGHASLIVGVIASIVVIILSIFIALFTANKISNPIKVVVERMRLIASGDLSNQALQVTHHDETGQLVLATNEMSDNMRKLLNEITTVSETVTGQSEELTQSANEVTSGAEQISITMEELAHGSETEANRAGDLSAAMSGFAHMVNEANNSGAYVQEKSIEVLQLTSDGSALMATSMEKIKVIDDVVLAAVQDVEGLDQHSQEISALVSVIQDIADQTNLLALNAAIEAARAGDEGKGFAVVADEVRKLAEESSKSVTNITGIVNRIQEESSMVTKNLRAGYQDVENSSQQIKTTGETFGEISGAINYMAENISKVTNNLANMTKSSQEMNNSIEEIAAITEESAAGIEETAASTQQTNSAMEEVAASSNELAHLAETLNDLVQRFKL